MTKPEYFNYAYYFTEKEERDCLPDGLHRPRFGLSQEMLTATYATELHKRLGLAPFPGIKKLSNRDCHALVKHWFWDVPELYAFPRKTGAVMLDMCVTHGMQTAFTLAQKAFNKTVGFYGSKLRVDGKMSYALVTALGNETNKLLLYMLAERLQLLEEILGNSPEFRLWLGRCARLKKYLGVKDEKRRLS